MPQRLNLSAQVYHRLELPTLPYERDTTRWPVGWVLGTAKNLQKSCRNLVSEVDYQKTARRNRAPHPSGGIVTLTLRKLSRRRGLPADEKETGTIMIVGPRDAAMAKRIGKASPYGLPRVEFLRAPEALLAQEQEPTGAPQPWLYVFNTARLWSARAHRKGVKFRMPSAQEARANARARASQQGEWLEVLRALQEARPATPVLVVADEHVPSSWEAFLEAGADEVITLPELRIAAVVKRRIESALAHARADREVQDGAIEPDTPLTEAEIESGLAKVREAVKVRPRARDRSDLVSDLLAIPVPELRAPSGRLDAKLIAQQLGVSINALARVMPLSRETLRTNPDSKRLQNALDPFARVLAMLDLLLQEDGGRQWLNTRHPRFAGTPLNAMLSGDAEAVARLLELTREGDVD